ncbi:MAG: arsenate reductase (glutaredoxin) [Xanthomonadaceae bacterium]|nr:arsenate reductase (glutaredoxin) [Xanthomonadaceae bacterium]
MARPAAILYHNPRCSKSRQALELLRAQGLEPEVVEYLKTPPTATELERILELLGREPRELLRTGEAEYQQLGLDDPTLSREALIQAMVDHPQLIERPILLTQRKAALGRPPENVLEIL